MPSIYRTVVGYRKRTSENCAICPIYKHHWKPAVPEQRNRQVEKNPERIQSERCSPIQSAAYRRFPPDRIRLHHRRSFPQTGPLQSKHNFGYLYTLIRKSIPAYDRCYDRCNRPGEEEKKGEMTSKQQNKQQGQKFRKRKKNENPADVGLLVVRQYLIKNLLTDRSAKSSRACRSPLPVLFSRRANSVFSSSNCFLFLHHAAFGLLRSDVHRHLQRR